MPVGAPRRDAHPHAAAAQAPSEGSLGTAALWRAAVAEHEAESARLFDP